MKLEYWYKELREAFLRNDYQRQSEIAKHLYWYEESGYADVNENNNLIMKILS